MLGRLVACLVVLIAAAPIARADTPAPAEPPAEPSAEPPAPATPAAAAAPMPGTAPAAAVTPAPITDAAPPVEPIAGEVIELTGEAPDLARPTTPVSYEVTGEVLRTLPGAGNDAMRALQSLPGVSRMPFGLGGLILRGTSPGNSSVFLDDIEVPIAFHFGGLASVYPSPLLASLEVTPGGGDVARGRNVGGVVELRSRAARTDRWRSGAELSLLDVSAYGEGPTGHGGGILIGLRRSHVGDVVEPFLPDEDRMLPRYTDGQLRWEQPLGRGAITALAFFSDDRVTRGEAADVRQSFVRAALRYQHQQGATTLTALGWIGWRRLVVRIDPYGDSGRLGESQGAQSPDFLRLRLLPLGGRAEVRHLIGHGHLAAGLDVQVDRRQQLFEGMLGADGTVREDPDSAAGNAVPPASAALGAWAEALWRIADGRLALKPGLRADHFTASDEWKLEPRLAVSHALSPRFTLRETFGVHHRPAPVGQSGTRRDEFRRPLSVAAYHSSIGAELALPHAIAATVTGYHVYSVGPVATPTTADDKMATIDDEDREDGLATALGTVQANLIGNELANDGGRFRARGIELLLRRQTERTLLWVSYTLSQAERNDGTAENGATWTRTSLDQTHNLNLIGSILVGHWRLGARLRYVTGAPYTPATLGIGRTGNIGPQWGPRYSERLASYVDIDLRVDRGWRRDWGTVAAYLDLQNATNADHVEGMSFDQDGQHPIYGLPVLPLLGVSFTPPP